MSHHCHVRLDPLPESPHLHKYPSSSSSSTSSSSSSRKRSSNNPGTGTATAAATSAAAASSSSPSWSPSRPTTNANNGRQSPLMLPASAASMPPSPGPFLTRQHSLPSGFERRSAYATSSSSSSSAMLSSPPKSSSSNNVGTAHYHYQPHQRISELWVGDDALPDDPSFGSSNGGGGMGHLFPSTSSGSNGGGSSKTTSSSSSRRRPLNATTAAGYGKGGGGGGGEGRPAALYTSMLPPAGYGRFFSQQSSSSSSANSPQQRQNHHPPAPAHQQQQQIREQPSPRLYTRSSQQQQQQQQQHGTSPSNASATALALLRSPPPTLCRSMSYGGESSIDQVVRGSGNKNHMTGANNPQVRRAHFTSFSSSSSSSNAASNRAEGGGGGMERSSCTRAFFPEVEGMGVGYSPRQPQFSLPTNISPSYSDHGSASSTTSSSAGGGVGGGGSTSSSGGGALSSPMTALAGVTGPRPLVGLPPQHPTMMSSSGPCTSSTETNPSPRNPFGYGDTGSSSTSSSSAGGNPPPSSSSSSSSPPQNFMGGRSPMVQAREAALLQLQQPGGFLPLSYMSQLTSNGSTTSLSTQGGGGGGGGGGSGDEGSDGGGGGGNVASGGGTGSGNSMSALYQRRRSRSSSFVSTEGEGRGEGRGGKNAIRGLSKESSSTMRNNHPSTGSMTSTDGEEASGSGNSGFNQLLKGGGKQSAVSRALKGCSGEEEFGGGGVRKDAARRRNDRVLAQRLEEAKTFVRSTSGYSSSTSSTVHAINNHTHGRGNDLSSSSSTAPFEFGLWKTGSGKHHSSYALDEDSGASSNNSLASSQESVEMLLQAAVAAPSALSPGSGSAGDVMGFGGGRGEEDHLREVSFSGRIPEEREERQWSMLNKARRRPRCPKPQEEDDQAMVVDEAVGHETVQDNQEKGKGGLEEGQLMHSSASTAMCDDVGEAHDRGERIDWRKGAQIGKGTFGNVFVGLNATTGERFAVKQIGLVDGSRTEVARLEKEILLMKRLRHKHIVRYLGTARDPHALFIFMEYVPGGSIASMLGQYGAFGEALTRRLVAQIVLGVHYLHSMGIIHRDIKGANVLVTNNGVAKLADFGCSRQLQDLQTSASASLENSLKNITGSVPWMAPEVIKQSGRLPKAADIWSLGATVIEMATAAHPWPEFSNQLAALFHVATATVPPALPPTMSEVGKDFVRRCLAIDEGERATAEELLRHPFIAGEVASEDYEMSNASPPRKETREDLLSLSSLNLGRER